MLPQTTSAPPFGETSAVREPALKVAGLIKVFETRGREKRYGRERAVDNVSIEVAQGAFFTLLGPSGCGKTTFLRCVAGLEQPTEGLISIAGRPVFDSVGKTIVPVYDRNLGMVFQSYAIWPHMSVLQNAVYPLEVQRGGAGRRERTEMAMQTLEMVGLSELAGRNATELSGGQQQRLALARALVQRPPLLLLDEPLSNLDAKLRETMRSELTRLQAELGLTVLYVTHDQSEALAMSTTIAVVNEGVIDQLATPREIYDQPRTRFVGSFIGRANFVTGRVRATTDSHHGLVETSFGPLSFRSSDAVTTGDKVEVLVRPEQIVFDPEPPPKTATGLPTVTSMAYQGDGIEYRLSLDGDSLLARSEPNAVFQVGDPVSLTCKDAVYPAFVEVAQ